MLSVTELHNTPLVSQKREKCNAREMVIWNKINNVHQLQPIYVTAHGLYKQIVPDRRVVQLLVVPLMLPNFSYAKVFLLQTQVTLVGFDYPVQALWFYYSQKIKLFVFQSFNSSCSFNRSIKYIQCLPKLLTNSITY